MGGLSSISGVGHGKQSGSDSICGSSSWGAYKNEAMPASSPFFALPGGYRGAPVSILVISTSL